MSKTAGEKLFDKERPKEKVLLKTYVAWKDLPSTTKEAWKARAKKLAAIKKAEKDG